MTDLFVLTSSAEGLRRRRWWRDSEHLKVGFTNGCFDILHLGHLHLLTEARRWCDKLIVAINADASVRALKGPSRPIHSLAERSRMLESLTAVDLVVSFDDPTPIKIIEAMRPDFLFKGGDYKRETIVGADFVESYGGRVIVIPFLSGYSTTDIIRRG